MMFRMSMIVVLPQDWGCGIGRPSRSAVSNAAESLARDLLDLTGLPGGEAVIWKYRRAETGRQTITDLMAAPAALHATAGHVLSARRLAHRLRPRASGLVPPVMKMEV